MKKIKIWMVCLITIGIFAGCGKKETTEIESANVVNTESTENIDNSDFTETEEEEISGNGEILFSTEYHVEDYCQGCFIVSKSDGLLYGALDQNGEEILPVKYDDISFVNNEEVCEGTDQNLYLCAEYENTYQTFDSKGKEIFDFRVERVDYEIGEPQKDTYFFAYKNEGKIKLFTEDQTLLCEVDVLQQAGLNPERAQSVEKTVYISKNNFMVYAMEYTVSEADDDEIGPLHSCFLLYDTQGNVVRQWNDEFSFSNGVDGELFVFDVSASADNKQLYSIDENGNLSDLGPLENQSEYEVYAAGIEKRDAPENPKDSEYDQIYHLGKKDEIKLYQTNDTWKLTDEQGKSLYEERYFDCYARKGGYFLVNEDQQICLIGREGKMIVPTEYMSWSGETGRFLGTEITDENCFIDYNSAVFVMENEGRSDIHYFSAQ